MSSKHGALNGIRVLDMTRVLAGPFCAQILGDLGAEVIKLERPRVGDDGRYYGFSAIKDADGNRTQESSFFVCCNRNKKSVTVNLSKPEGQEIVRKLAAEADVLIENYKVGDLKRYGLDYESLKAINPRLVFCSVTGFGQTGPSAPKPGYDGLFQAQGGMMAVTGIPEGEPGAGPLKAGPSLVDVFTGHNAAIAILAALNHRHNSGHGQYIDIALLDSSIAMVSHVMQDYLIAGEAPPRIGNGGNGGGPADLIRCKDGMVYITAGTDEAWFRVCELMERPELFKDPRFATNMLRGMVKNRRELIAIINEWASTWKTEDMIAAFDRITVPIARYNELSEVFDDPQAKHRGLKVTIPHPIAGSVSMIGSPLAHMSETPADHFTAPPLLGQNTDEVLREILGMNENQIAALHACGAV